MEPNQIFALDIGTRKVVGLVLEKDGQKYNILAAEYVEHSTRAMLDGQIHDVEAVAAVITQIKKSLEEKLGITLEKAAVAAAGRALKTARGYVSTSRGLAGEISEEEMRALELEAVQNAQYTLAQAEISSSDRSNYFCVGYSVVCYRVEDQEIASLVGQTGSEVAVEVIATFLPRIVVDSLFSVLKRSGLQVFSLTLEPIAALAVAIPPSMRLLNLALVDIGAGTSDIAIVKNGKISAYAMVPIGGDELTEFISSQWLLDFNQAENLKRTLSNQEQVEFTDILGNTTIMGTADINEILQPPIKELAQAIAVNIIEVNQKTPDAVLCVGGGTLAPLFIMNLADALGMPRNRIGIKSRANLDHICGDFPCLEGPQGVTPIGIAFNSFDKPPVPVIKVTVNGRETALWNMGETDVMHALINSGIALNNLYGKPGMGKTIEVNGYIKVVKGEMGTSPLIQVNGSKAPLQTIVHDGDIIFFSKGQDGKNASLTLRDLVNGTSGYVQVNGEKVQLLPLITVNGQPFDPDQELPDMAKVEMKRVNQVRDILMTAGLAEHLLCETLYSFELNGQHMVVRWSPVLVTVDGIKASLDQTVNFGSCIEYSLRSERPRIKDILPEETSTINVTVNEKPVVLHATNYTVSLNGREVSSADEVIYNGASLTAVKKEASCILSDIFKEIEINPASARGKLVIEVDGKPAGYTTPIFDKSSIKLIWED
ncbi:MAG: cell division FtsA domain-containing protein [Syntrophomonadaceae bacterium]|jgi:cell division protein FtsA